MGRGKAKDAGGLTPAKDDNAAPYHFDPRTLPFFKCVDYSIVLGIEAVLSFSARLGEAGTDRSGPPVSGRAAPARLRI